MWWCGDGMHSGWMVAGVVLTGAFWVGLLGLVWAGITRPGGRGSVPTPDEILKARLAKGELSLEDYQHLKDALRS